MKNSIRSALLGAALAGIAWAAGCAKGSNIIDTTGGEGGAGGASGSGGSGAADGPATSTGTTSSGNGAAATSAASGTASSSSAASGPGATSSSSVGASSSSGLMCPKPEHFCNGVCANNTPDTGCTSSVSCTPCAAPLNGTATCTVGGVCDFTCAAPYQKSGASCVCGAACCTNADCGGGGATCVNGACMAPPSCDQQTCTAGCLISCLPKFGVGICLNNMCVCQCN